jgi:hypothetical protein
LRDFSPVFILTSGVCNLNTDFAQKTPKILTEMEKIMNGRTEATKNDILQLLENATPEQIDLVWRFLHAMST